MAALHPMGEGHPPHPTPSKRSFADILSSSAAVAPISCLKPRENYRGEPAVSFSAEDVRLLSSPLKFALIGKFSRGRPSMEGLRKDFMSVGFKGSFSLGLLDPRHVLIRFDLEDDFHRCWLRGFWTFQGFAMRVFSGLPHSLQISNPL